MQQMHKADNNFRTKNNGGIIRVNVNLLLIIRSLQNLQAIIPNLASFSRSYQGLFWVSPGAEIWPHFQWNLGDFFPNFGKKNIFYEDWDFHSVNTHTSYMVTFYYHCILFFLQFNGNSMFIC